MKNILNDIYKDICKTENNELIKSYSSLVKEITAQDENPSVIPSAIAEVSEILDRLEKFKTITLKHASEDLKKQTQIASIHIKKIIELLTAMLSIKDALVVEEEPDFK